jgi:16S rRNA (guanine527-N7)-methyltransferase
VSSKALSEGLLRRAEKVGLRVSDDTTRRLEAYMALLAKWNAKINLTALPLDPPTDEAFDRLLIEPLLAARHIGTTGGAWVDLGSGGGSPALPMKAVHLETPLTMVESKGRKAVFLREAVVAMGLVGAHVENVRFEEVDRLAVQTAQLVTVRGVRADVTLMSVVSRLLDPEGRLLLFRPPGSPLIVPGLDHIESIDLVVERGSCLSVYRRMFHVEHGAHGR